MNACPTIEAQCVAEREGWDAIRRAGAPGAGARTTWSAPVVPERACALRLVLLLEGQMVGWQITAREARMGHRGRANAIAARLTAEWEPHTRCLPTFGLVEPPAGRDPA